MVGIDGMEVGAEMERKPKTKHHEITQTVPIIANIIVILNIIEEGKHIQIIRRQISSGESPLLLGKGSKTRVTGIVRTFPLIFFC